MIQIEEVEKIHDILIEKFGGAKGIRDKAIFIDRRSMNRVLIILHLLLLESCVMEPPYDDRLLIINNSKNVICFDYQLDTALDIPSINKKEYFISKRLYPGDSSRIERQGSTNQWISDISHGKDSTLSIFLFDYEQVLVNNWDTLRANRKYKRLDYKLIDLNKINWTVILD